jgi:ribosome recycling factor
MDAMEIIRQTEDKMKKTDEEAGHQFATVRTGRANRILVEDIKVDYHGSQTVLKHIAAINIPDPRLIVIQPWDPGSIETIERAILKSDIGITPINDGKIIRLGIPQLTKERRDEMTRLVRKIAEEMRVSIRSTRRAALETLKKMQKDSKITEDDYFRYQDQIQKLTDKAIEKIDTMLNTKEKELMVV